MSETAPDARRGAPGLAAAVYAFAFTSAVAALVYEVVWTRMLALAFGRTTLAAGAVVAGFMGGMALGAGLFHRVSRPRPRAALRLYGALELGIAASALALTWQLGGVPQLFAAMAGALDPGLGLTLARLALAMLLLALPAAFMGATYPALCAVVIHTREGVGRHLGRIYGLNTLGAAAGALTAGLVWIEWLGLRASAELAAAGNAVLGLAALALAARVAEGGASREALGDEEATLASALPLHVTAAVLVGSGFATLAYEIVWFRALLYLFGNSTYALTLMLVVFLLGLGLGGLLFGPVARRARPERDLALCQIAIALLALAAIGGEAAVLSSPDLAAHVSVFSSQVAERGWVGRLLADAGLALGLMLPATLFMGLSFPLATRLYLRDVRRLGQGVGGSVVLANSGSIAGSIGAALVVLPFCGTVGGTRALAAFNLGLGLLVLAHLRGPRRRRLAVAALAVAATAALGAALPPRLAFFGESHVALRDAVPLFEEEGDLATVQVWESRSQPGRRVMTIDGVTIAVSRGGFYPIYSKQLVLAHLPLLLDASIRRTLSVGLGSASTLDALASHPSLQVLDAVEINGGVVRGSAYFEESAVLSDPRVRVAVDDAVSFLLRARSDYDLIVSDGKQNPDFSSNWTLMCREFYQQALARLGERGLFAQWIPLSTVADDFRTTLRTFSGVFPEVEVFLDAPQWVILVGSRAPIAGRRQPRPLLWHGLRARRDLASLGLPSRKALLAEWVTGGEALRETLGPGPISTWDHSPLEFSAYRTPAQVKARAPRDNLALLLEAGARSRARGRSPFVAARWARSARLVRRAHLLELEGQPEAARRRLERAVAANPADPRARRLLAQAARDRRGGPEAGGPGGVPDAGVQEDLR
jgi:spermidine synthase